MNTQFTTQDTCETVQAPQLPADDRTGGETECKLAQTVAAFLGKNMES